MFDVQRTAFTIMCSEACDCLEHYIPLRRHPIFETVLT